MYLKQGLSVSLYCFLCVFPLHASNVYYRGIASIQLEGGVSVQVCSNVFCFVGFDQFVVQDIKYLETSLLLRNR